MISADMVSAEQVWRWWRNWASVRVCRQVLNVRGVFVFRVAMSLSLSVRRVTSLRKQRVLLRVFIGLLFRRLVFPNDGFEGVWRTSYRM